MKRQDIRDSAFKIIFESLLRNDSIGELYALADDADEIIVNDKVKEIVEGTLANREKINEMIQLFAQKELLTV